MNGSILEDVKKLIGALFSYDVFDIDLIMHINSVLFSLNQMGIGKEGFRISSNTDTWADFLEKKQLNLDALKSYVALKVKLLFDPPTSGILMDAAKENLKELEWRIYITENYVGEI